MQYSTRIWNIYLVLEPHELEVERSKKICDIRTCWYSKLITADPPKKELFDSVKKPLRSATRAVLWCFAGKAKKIFLDTVILAVLTSVTIISRENVHLLV